MAWAVGSPRLRGPVGVAVMGALVGHGCASSDPAQIWDQPVVERGVNPCSDFASFACGLDGRAGARVGDTWAVPLIEFLDKLRRGKVPADNPNAAFLKEFLVRSSSPSRSRCATLRRAWPTSPTLTGRRARGSTAWCPTSRPSPAPSAAGLAIRSCRRDAARSGEARRAVVGGRADVGIVPWPERIPCERGRHGIGRRTIWPTGSRTDSAASWSIGSSSCCRPRRWSCRAATSATARVSRRKGVAP